jgi:hypothetical protein
MNLRKAVVISGVAVAIAAASAQPAAAADQPTFTVSAGSAPAGAHVGFQTDFAGLLLTDSSSHSVQCTSGWPTTLNVVVGSGESGNGIFRMPTTGTPAGTCTLNHSIALSMVAHGTWRISAKRYLSGFKTTRISVWGISLSLTNQSSSPSCSFNLQGSFRALLLNSGNGASALLQPDTQAPTSNVKLEDLQGCAGQGLQFTGAFTVGSHWSYAAKHNSAYTQLTVTSP